MTRLNLWKRREPDRFDKLKQDIEELDKKIEGVKLKRYFDSRDRIAKAKQRTRTLDTRSDAGPDTVEETFWVPEAEDLRAIDEQVEQVRAEVLRVEQALQGIASALTEPVGDRAGAMRILQRQALQRKLNGLNDFLREYERGGAEVLFSEETGASKVEILTDESYLIPLMNSKEGQRLLGQFSKNLAAEIRKMKGETMEAIFKRLGEFKTQKQAIEFLNQKVNEGILAPEEAESREIRKRIAGLPFIEEEPGPVLKFSTPQEEKLHKMATKLFQEGKAKDIPEGFSKALQTKEGIALYVEHLKARRP